MMKEAFLIFLFSCTLFCTSHSQKVSLDASINGYIFTLRTTDYPNYNVIPSGLISVMYSNKINSKFDYKVGVGKLSGKEFYFLRDAPLDIDQTIGEEYYSCYLLLNLGGQYWFNENRKGLYIQFLLIPHMLIWSKKEVSFNMNTQWGKIETSGKDSFEAFNFLLNTGVGYDLYLYKGLSAYLSFNGSLLIGPYVKDGVDDIKFTRALSLGLSYRL